MIFLKRLGSLIRGNTCLYITAVVSMAITVLLTLTTPLIVKITVDSVIAGNEIEAPGFIVNFIEKLGGTSFLSKNLWVCGLAVVVVALANGLFSYIKGRATASATESIAKTLKDNLYNHIENLPYEYHTKAQAGDLIQRCTSDVETIRKFLASQIIEIGRILLIILVSITIMATLNVKMTLVAFTIIPVILLFSIVFFVKIRNVFQKSDEKEGELSTILQENLSGIRVVRAFGRQKFEAEKFDKSSSEFKDLVFEIIRAMAWYWSLSDFFCYIQLIILIVMGVYMENAGEITLGTFLVFSSYEAMLLHPVRQLGRILSEVGKTEVSLGRVFEILNTTPENQTENGLKPSLNGDIEFKDVCFQYEKDKPVIENMSFKIKKGETIAILGATGSGKSTIMHLLLRLYDYDKGSITINKVELRNIEKKWLRKKIGIVLQEPFLFSKSINENLKMAKDNVSEKEIKEATETACVDRVIESFEKGYNTVVGEKGVTLSGGQKQRVSIARTLIKDNDILIFDDSLSSVDTETDLQIRTALKENQKSKTTIIISQRITTLKQADKIFIIDNGKIKDSGTHDELILRKGLYSKIWDIQNRVEEVVV